MHESIRLCCLPLGSRSTCSVLLGGDSFLSYGALTSTCPAGASELCGKLFCVLSLIDSQLIMILMI